MKAFGSGTFDQFTAVNGRLFFTADTALGRELWRSNGATGGTVIVADIYPGAQGSDPGPLLNVNGTLFFGAVRPDIDRELWAVIP